MINLIRCANERCNMFFRFGKWDEVEEYIVEAVEHSEEQGIVKVHRQELCDDCKKEVRDAKRG